MTLGQKWVIIWILLVTAANARPGMFDDDDGADDDDDGQSYKISEGNSDPSGQSQNGFNERREAEGADSETTNMDSINQQASADSAFENKFAGGFSSSGTESVTDNQQQSSSADSTNAQPSSQSAASTWGDSASLATSDDDKSDKDQSADTAKVAEATSISDDKDDSASESDASTSSLGTQDYSSKTDDKSASASSSDVNSAPAASNNDNSASVASNNDNSASVASNNENSAPATSTIFNSAPVASNNDNSAPAASNNDNSAPAASTNENSAPAASTNEKSAPAASNPAPASKSTESWAIALTSNGKIASDWNSDGSLSASSLTSADPAQNMVDISASSDIDIAQSIAQKRSATDTELSALLIEPGERLSAPKREAKKGRALKLDFGASGARKGSKLRMRFPTSFCELERDNGIICPGIRRGNFIDQFYFDPSTNRCYHYVYNGCGGNANRFSSLWECTQSCAKKVTKTIE